MSDHPPHACPASGGAHRFEPDASGVPICACGEIEVSPEMALMLTETDAGPFPGEVLLPRVRRRRVIEGINASLISRGLEPMDTDALLEAQERDWTGAGGLLHPGDG